MTLSSSELTTSADSASLSFTLTNTNQQSIAMLTTPQLDIDAGAVKDLYGNLINEATDQSISISHILNPEITADETISIFQNAPFSLADHVSCNANFARNNLALGSSSSLGSFSSNNNVDTSTIGAVLLTLSCTDSHDTTVIHDLYVEVYEQPNISSVSSESFSLLSISENNSTMTVSFDIKNKGASSIDLNATMSSTNQNVPSANFSIEPSLVTIPSDTVQNFVVTFSKNADTRNVPLNTLQQGVSFNLTPTDTFLKQGGTTLSRDILLYIYDSPSLQIERNGNSKFVDLTIIPNSNSVEWTRNHFDFDNNPLEIFTIGGDAEIRYVSTTIPVVGNTKFSVNGDQYRNYKTTFEIIKDGTLTIQLKANQFFSIISNPLSGDGGKSKFLVKSSSDQQTLVLDLDPKVNFPKNLKIVPGTTITVPLPKYVMGPDGVPFNFEVFFTNGTKVPRQAYTYDNATKTITAVIPPNFESTVPLQFKFVLTNPFGTTEKSITVPVQDKNPTSHVFMLRPIDVTNKASVKADINSGSIKDVSIRLAKNSTFSYIVEKNIDVRSFVSDSENHSTFGGQPINFLPGGIDVGFNSTDTVCPCEITMTYDDSEIPIGVSEDSLVIWHFTNNAWNPLPTKSHDTIANIITGVTQSFSPFGIGSSFESSSSGDNASKKGGGGGDSKDWKKKPTFGTSWETNSQLVTDGFSFNNYRLTVDDNWHTEFQKTRSIIGESNTVVMKSYAANGFKTVSVALGIPEIGQKHNAETEIILNLQRNYTSPVGFEITDIIHEQKESLVNVNATTASIQKAKCNESHTDSVCYLFEIDFTIMAPLKHDVLAISAMDEKRRFTTTYINEGVSFDGKSLLSPASASLFLKSANQDPGKYIVLTQEDRRYELWKDQDGSLWTKNEYGTWKQLTSLPDAGNSSKPTKVMTRLHSDYGTMMQDEIKRAIQVWDSDAIQGKLLAPFAYDISEVNRSISKLEKLADQLKIEEQNAQEFLNKMIYDPTSASHTHKQNNNNNVSDDRTLAEILSEHVEHKSQSIIHNTDEPYAEIQYKKNMLSVSGDVGNLQSADEHYILLQTISDDLYKETKIAINNDGSFELKFLAPTFDSITVTYGGMDLAKLISS